MKRSNWKLDRKADFLSRIGKMLEEGYSLAKALEVYALYQNDQTRFNIETIMNRLKEGDSFHDVLSDFHFPPDILSYLYMSEQRDFATGISASGQLMKTRSEWQKRLRSTLAYPIFLFWMTAIMLFVVGKYLLPQFNALYESLDVPLPLVSRIFMELVRFMPAIVGISILLCIFYYLSALLKNKRTSAVNKMLFYSKLPLAHLFIPLYLTHHTSLHLGLLLHSGLSISEAYVLLKKQSHFIFFQEEAERVSSSLMRGERLEVLFENTRLYVPEFKEILMHGQASGNLGRELILYGEVVGERFQELVKKGFVILQPVSFVGVGIVVMLMFMSILLPMFYYLQSI
ncbi:competence type IV pilus assembly protein ComGB [Guptibacillus hwajinpoensis]|uniref:Competence protein ComGB n=1 Tax=Guptibacillus hwajinpoensis TaxID=208199 RepID=A0ABU0JX92_9BACL|nr:competence type IV pilus assembly protein ComGB [Alkalihalobacillus hemicentroti]MDQ0481678.1 competence protein ComGB [Alkalihalobacillus hemicentroti]